MVDCVSVEKESGRGFFLPRGILTFAFRIIYCYTCRACLDEITCVAEHYLTLRIGCERHGSKNPLPFPFSTLTQSTICTQATPQGKRVFKEGRNRRCLPFLFPRRTAHVPRTPQRAKSLAQKWRTSLPDEILHPICRPVHRMLRLMRRVLGIPPHRRIEHRAGRYHRNHRACHRSGCNAGNKR